MKVDVRSSMRYEEAKPTMYKDDAGNIILLSDSDPDSLICITPDGYVEVRMSDEYSLLDLTVFRGSVTLSQD